ncbi:hypothetical protein V7S43_000492 [Phytophthora oleae]|uniref:Uncharacterized protein n=1 Tax=Phytophthora oleae TaxID=2107226 RepID=A0ABD3G9R2_9STRA
MTGRERWSLLDGAVLRRRRSAQAAIDQFLDRLVDIFDFPLAPPSYNDRSSVPPLTRKDPAADVYITMDEAISRSRECTVGNSLKKPRRASVADRVRELLVRKTTRNSVVICNSKSNNTSEARTLHMSWLSEERKAPTEPQDELWVERDEQDRQLQCGYQTLADEATI